MERMTFNLDEKKYSIVFCEHKCTVTDTQTKKTVTLDCTLSVLDMINILRG
jgi:hypothetical protein